MLRGYLGSIGARAEMLAVLSKQKLIRHPRNVVAHDHVPRVRARKLLMWFRHRPRRGQVVPEKLFQAAHRTVTILSDLRPVINIRKQEPLEFRIARAERLAKPRNTFRQPPDILHRCDPRLRHPLIRRFDQVGDQLIQHVLKSLVEFKLFARGRIRCFRHGIGFPENRHFAAQSIQIKKLRLPRIIEVSSGLGISLGKTCRLVNLSGTCASSGTKRRT